MQIGSSGSTPGMHAFAAGVRGQLQAQQLRTGLDAAGVGDPSLTKAVDALESQSASVATAALEIANQSHAGQILDLLA